jgi:hypothetical protein
MLTPAKVSPAILLEHHRTAIIDANSRIAIHHSKYRGSNTSANTRLLNRTGRGEAVR